MNYPIAARGRAARRRVWLAAARAVSTARAALIRMTRRVAEAGLADAVAPPRTKLDAIQVLQDEYRAGFPLPVPHQASAASDLHECQWCISLGHPDTLGRSTPPHTDGDDT